MFKNDLHPIKIKPQTYSDLKTNLAEGLNNLLNNNILASDLVDTLQTENWYGLHERGILV